MDRRLAYLLRHVIPAAYTLLPPAMASDAATRMLLAIAWQESGLRHRRQVVGPARGWWQFERGGGVAGVLGHPSTRDAIRDACAVLHHPPTSTACHVAIEHDDVLGACFARCLLWTLPVPLPASSAGAWAQYLDAWRPGKPHPETWSGHWRTASAVVRA